MEKIILWTLRDGKWSSGDLQLYNYYLGTPDGLATDLARYTSLSAQALLDEANATLDPAFCQTIIITLPRKRSHNGLIHTVHLYLSTLGNNAAAHEGDARSR